MAVQSSILAWGKSWIEEPGGLQFIGLDMTERAGVRTHTRTHTHRRTLDHLEGYWMTWKHTGSPIKISDHLEGYLKYFLPKFESICFYSHDLHYHCYYSNSWIYKRYTRVYKSKLNSWKNFQNMNTPTSPIPEEKDHQ